MQKPKISIVVPVYNVERYITECLDSCVNQILEDIEIVVVDDCGNDKSIEIAKGFARSDSRVRVIHNKENMKLMLARFEGAKVARGEYIIFLDSDDFLELDVCERLWRLVEHKRYDRVSFGTWRYFDGEEGQKEIFHCYETKEFLSIEAFADWVYRQKYFMWNICGNMIKTSAYLEAFGRIDRALKITMAEDVLTSYALWNVCKLTLFSDFVGYNYRYNEDSSSNAKDIIKMQRNLEDINYVISEIKRISVKCPVNKRIEQLFLWHITHERDIMDYEIKKLKNKITIKDKIYHWLEGRCFTLQRRKRVLGW